MLAHEARRAIPGLVPLYRRRARPVVPRGGALPLPHLQWPAGGRPRSECAPCAQPIGMDAAVRRPLQAHDVAVRQRCVGQEGVGRPGARGHQRGQPRRGRHEPVLGQSLRAVGRPPGPVDQAVRQQPHGQLQRPGHDRAGERRQADDRARQAHPGGRMRLYGRHIGQPGRVLRGGWHSLGGTVAARRRFDRPAGAAAGEWVAGAGARHRL